MATEKYDEKVDTSPAGDHGLTREDTYTVGQVDNADQLQRHLGNRQVQLIAIGGSIGTATFVSIANGLVKGGPGSLLLAYTLYTCMLGLVNNSMAEMASYMPVSGGFIRMAGHWVDESLGFWVGWNFFLYEAFLIPFEISALNLVLTYWSDKIPVAAVVAVCIVLYFCINAFVVKWYGEAEFWLALGKVFLILIVYMFTFITMVGGNPQKDAYGFRYWKEPGAFAEFITTGPLGRFEGFLGCLWSAAFTVVGPEYLSMLSGEVKLPRRYLKAAFKVTYIRFAFFFIGSALCVGIVIPYNESSLLEIMAGTSEGAGTAAASPYVIAMRNLGVTGLPHLTNALLCTSIFSAGNAYTYYGTRSLYSLALDGHAPKFLRKCTKAGVPMYCLIITSLFPFLGFLNVSSGSAKVLTWFTNIITAAQIIDYIVICITYLFFYRACKAQGLDRRTMPYFAQFQPWSTWIAMIFLTCVVTCYGYPVFLPGRWSLDTFFTFYLMVLVAPVLFFGWKFLKKTKFIKPLECDLIWQKAIIDAYEENFNEPATGFWQEIGHMFLCGRSIKKSKA
ncbi:hypothetical protein CC86DRAFT_368063 [Ophiobolus disseminans]|uniref:Amino acid permease/ SLC12A domain-containing protein n=1 Tax=Ophiobolus disseminans TaxID=1469910 RepID=A0A6A7AC24_9PLEO|nr:hypothetical protein CC86DRAFT_368063 [Ophiobolus disseminans]